jgi:hypothetical protein
MVGYYFFRILNLHYWLRRATLCSGSLNQYQQFNIQRLEASQYIIPEPTKEFNVVNYPG